MDTSGELPHVTWLRECGACAGGLAHAATCPSMKATWETCPHTAWMGWLIGRCQHLGHLPAGAYTAACRAYHDARTAALAVDAKMPHEGAWAYGREAVRALYPNSPVPAKVGV